MTYIAIDTETYKGRAFLLSWADGCVEINSWQDFLKHCYALGRKFTTFNLDYDASAIFRYLPPETVEGLYLNESVQVGNLRLRYLVGKYLEIVGDRRGGLRFYDIYPFFQTTLDQAGFKFVGMRKKELPRGIIGRNGIAPRVYKRHKKIVQQYAVYDAAITQKLTELIEAALKEIKLEVKHLYSPGYIAKRFLASNKIKVRDVPGKFQKFASAAYHGARIEVVQRGTFPQAAIYDIKSAYPSAFRELPDLLHAQYHMSKKIESKWFIARVRVFAEPAYLHLLPVKKDGLTYFPQFTGQETTITCYEYDYLKKHKLAKIEVLEVLNIVCNGKKPFRKMINKLFAERKKSAGKNLLFKLILNSLYGIFAESLTSYEKVDFVRGYYQGLRQLETNYKRLFVAAMARRCENARAYWEKACTCEDCKFTRRIVGKKQFRDKALFQKNGEFYLSRKKAGRFRNIVLAAFVTAQVRVKIFDLARQSGKSFIACFTDSIITGKRIKYATGEKLGDLEKKYSGKVVMLGSGIYETAEETKMRGFRWKKKLSGLIRDNRGKKVLRIPQKMRVSLGIFVRRPLIKFDDFNDIKTRHKDLEVNFDRKRIWEDDFKNAGEVLRRKIGSKPFRLTNS